MIIKEYPEFSWSFSRHKTMMDCLKKYYLSYYGFHNGWLHNADAIKKHIYRLKKITNLEMILGSKVHEYIETLIHSNFHKDLMNPKVMFNTIWKDIEKTINSSFHQYNDWYEKPSKVQMLHEVYYENDIPNEKMADMKERLNTIVHNLFENETFQNMVKKKVKNQPDSEKYRYMNRDGVKIWVRLDLHYTDSNNNRTIVDWKTGKSNKDDRYQLALYSHFISKAYNISDLSRIGIRNEYLLNNESKAYKVNQLDINNMKELINTSIEYMQSFLEDAEKNIPLDDSCFTKTANQSICSRCNFKEICNVSSD
ncbi:CRISPR/Cas system-associated exonuclease Cas4 (RecB family) [Oikeobacillus pervagus]|uniref:CRISPR/Cas system-associated exonuclease Cas4 (RecB family) n=1 Tax=Oikeobacillus pervagus TaxID=1325931 RepID=A0AAJ1T6L9_9BACI|nr:PD-(D/E)XK nuclease family protein [Oikeobacillus pervagus]MDQ0216849.1 CRISPR/Cas system-associated exonuclease Cas4 (RecB family) [Oikeobacillus pervagus]